MEQSIKISPEELNELNSLKESIQKNIFEFGELYMEKLELDSLYKDMSKKEQSLISKTEELKKRESELITNILKKYGEGNLNISTGVFTPNQ